MVQGVEADIKYRLLFISIYTAVTGPLTSLSSEKPKQKFPEITICLNAMHSKKRLNDLANNAQDSDGKPIGNKTLNLIEIE